VRDAERPLTELARQGWEVARYDAVLGSSGLTEHAFHLTRHGEHKLLVIRRKYMGEGIVAEEIDV
jgi:hypothetical protein